ncbi:sugar phosphate isomerase/epimerase [Prosthecobacter fusiformis]|uniref:Sugar phosphate isomerase/epimerase n=1 Tax=Prosthecobacter fusiformis TaxID=48464 RepID=A0A4R7RJV3_9BACT|nr:TIM barrel protein [Prosthecobacter fusiformis]TDU63105.1 sugar phosphate isomerase/epimerase [Prosthecobacter fusiformis]
MNTRRHFLTTLLGTSATGFLAAQEAGLSYKGENIQFGLVTYMWGAEWDLPTLITNCEAADVLGVELRVQHAHKVEPALNAEQRKEVRLRFENSSVKVLGMGTNAMFHSPDAAELQKNIASAKEYIKLSHDIGGSGVKVKPNNLPKDVPVEKTLEQIGKALAELGDYALGFGQEIRLEVHGDVCDLGQNKTIMEVAARDNVRVCWNSNPDDLKGEGIEANFAKVLPYLGKTAHIREVNQGSYPYDKLTQLLVEADYEGWVLLEARGKPVDLVSALAEQKKLFMSLVTAARKAAA